MSREKILIGKKEDVLEKMFILNVFFKNFLRENVHRKNVRKGNVCKENVLLGKTFFKRSKEIPRETPDTSTKIIIYQRQE